MCTLISNERSRYPARAGAADVMADFASSVRAPAVAAAAARPSASHAAGAAREASQGRHAAALLHPPPQSRGRAIAPHPRRQHVRRHVRQHPRPPRSRRGVHLSRRIINTLQSCRPQRFCASLQPASLWSQWRTTPLLRRICNSYLRQDVAGGGGGRGSRSRQRSRSRSTVAPTAE